MYVNNIIQLLYQSIFYVGYADNDGANQDNNDWDVGEWMFNCVLPGENISKFDNLITNHQGFLT